MKLLVIGASSGIGLEVVKRALADGHGVRAFARSAEEMDISDAGFEAFAGNALDGGDLARALAGIDAVILALGVPLKKSTPLDGTSLFSKATETLLPAMREAGVDRLLAVTGFGAGDSKDAMSALERAGHHLLLGGAYADKDTQEEMIKASDLRWTLVRPVILTGGGRSGRYKVLTDPSDWRNGLISRGDVADYLVRAAAGEMHVHQAVVLAR